MNNYSHEDQTSVRYHTALPGRPVITANLIRSPTSLEIHIRPSVDFKRFSKQVKKVGGDYTSIRGDARGRIVSVPNTPEGHAVADALLSDNGDRPNKGIVRGYGGSLSGKATVHSNVKSCSDLLDRFWRVVKATAREITGPLPLELLVSTRAAVVSGNLYRDAMGDAWRRSVNERGLPSEDRASENDERGLAMLDDEAKRCEDHVMRSLESVLTLARSYSELRSTITTRDDLHRLADKIDSTINKWRARNTDDETHLDATH